MRLAFRRLTRSYQRLRNFAVSIALVALIGASALPVRGADPIDAFDMTLEENLNQPKLSGKSRNAAVSRNNEIASDLSHRGLKVSKQRNGEVLVVAIPCSVAFSPNVADSLTAEGERLLNFMVPYVELADRYKTVVTVHSDNTGSETYRDSLTESRAEAICAWLEQHAITAAEKQTVIPYGVGHDEPLGDDESIAARARNRRIEIYLVPIK